VYREAVTTQLFAPIVTRGAIHFGAARPSCAMPSGIPAQIIPLDFRSQPLKHRSIVRPTIAVHQGSQRFMPWVLPLAVGESIPKCFPIYLGLPWESLSPSAQYSLPGQDPHRFCPRSCSANRTPQPDSPLMWRPANQRVVQEMPAELDRLAEEASQAERGNCMQSQAVSIAKWYLN